MLPDHGLPQLRRVSQHAMLYAQVRQELWSAFCEERLGANPRFDFDVSGRRIELGSGSGALVMEAELLASIAVNPTSILWGFAGPFAAYVGHAPLAGGIRHRGQEWGLDELTNEETAYTAAPGAELPDVAAEVAHWIGALGVEIFGPATLYYSYPTGTKGSRHVALVQQHDLPVPPVTLVDVFVRFPRMASTLDDVAWSLEGLARLRQGWRVEQRDADGPAQQAFRLFDETGAWFDTTITRDEHQRIVNVKCDGVHRAGA